MSLAAAIRRFAQPVTVTRGSVGTTTNGRYTPGATSTIAVQASVQPVSGRDLMRLPEGLRTRELVALFAETELRTVDAGAGTPADLVAVNGASYEVQTVERWAELGGFWKAIAMKVGA